MESVPPNEWVPEMAIDQISTIDGVPTLGSHFGHWPSHYSEVLWWWWCMVLAYTRAEVTGMMQLFLLNGHMVAHCVAPDPWKFAWFAELEWKAIVWMSLTSISSIQRATLIQGAVWNHNEKQHKTTSQQNDLRIRALEHWATSICCMEWL